MRQHRVSTAWSLSRPPTVGPARTHSACSASPWRSCVCTCCRRGRRVFCSAICWIMRLKAARVSASVSVCRMTCCVAAASCCSATRTCSDISDMHAARALASSSSTRCRSAARCCWTSAESRVQTASGPPGPSGASSQRLPRSSRSRARSCCWTRNCSRICSCSRAAVSSASTAARGRQPWGIAVRKLIQCVFRLQAFDIASPLSESHHAPARRLALTHTHGKGTPGPSQDGSSVRSQAVGVQ